MSEWSTIVIVVIMGAAHLAGMIAGKVSENTWRLIHGSLTGAIIVTAAVVTAESEGRAFHWPAWANASMSWVISYYLTSQVTGLILKSRSQGEQSQQS